MATESCSCDGLPQCFVEGCFVHFLLRCMVYFYHNSVFSILTRFQAFFIKILAAYQYIISSDRSCNGILQFTLK